MKTGCWTWPKCSPCWWSFVGAIALLPVVHPSACSAHISITPRTPFAPVKGHPSQVAPPAAPQHGGRDPPSCSLEVQPLGQIVKHFLCQVPFSQGAHAPKAALYWPPSPCSPHCATHPAEWSQQYILFIQRFQTTSAPLLKLCGRAVQQFKLGLGKAMLQLQRMHDA